MAVEDINAKGGLLGRPLEIVFFDTVDISPERVELASNELAKKGVACAHGGWSGTGGDVRSFGKYKYPYFMNDGSESSLKVMLENPKEYYNVFMVSDIEKTYAREYFQGMVDLERDFGYKYPNKNVASIAARCPWGEGIQNGLADFAKENGWNVVMREVVPYGTTEWGPILAKLRALNPVPAWLQVEIVSPRDVITLFRSYMKAPIKMLINYGWSGNSPEFLSLMGKEADGLVVGNMLPLPPPTKGAEEWVERFKKKYGDAPSAAVPSIYNGVYAWAKAVAAVGDETKFDEISKYVATQSFEAIPGIPFSFAGGVSDHSIDVPYSSSCQVQIQDGTFKTLSWKGKRYTDWQGKSYNFIVPRWMK
jgi:branched-chain amino acid transport system substrate-binding protein